MTDPDFRDLCAELVKALEEYDASDPYRDLRDLLARADAALAQPAPEPSTPISEFDLMQQWNAQAEKDDHWDTLASYEKLAFAQARAVAVDRARWGQGNA
jgi:hypothetical protein